MALGRRPYLQKSDCDYKTQFKTPIKIRIVGEDFGKHIGGVIVPLLYEWIPRSEFTFKEGNPKKNQQGIPVFWTFNNGSTIELLSYEQDTDFFEGWDGQIVHFDEPPPRDIYIACKRGLIVKSGICMFSMTPLKEPWIYDQIVLRSETDESVFFIISEIRDNLIHEREWYGKKVPCGALTEESIIRFEADLTDDEKEARIRGRFMHLSGLVYKEFNPQTHRIPWFMPRGEWTWYEAIDPHPRKEKAVTIMAIAEDDTKYIVDEIWSKGLVKDIVQAILQKRKDYGYIPKFTLIDPLAVAPDQISNTTVLNEYINESGNKIYPLVGSKDRNRGIDLLKKELSVKYADKAGIYIMENCRETLYEFGHYIWKDREDIDNVKGKDEPEKTNDHMLENIHRILIAGAKYIPPRDESTKRVIRGIGR
uniref:Putative terminase n=1 Tax=viral metagenome TaxID=1070528 RepID=A0A6M3ISK7_9ZZZZ